MESQRYRHRIQIVEKLETQNTETGDLEETYRILALEDFTALDSVPAEVLTGPGREFNAADAMQAETAIRVNFRWFPGLLATHHIFWDGKLYDIQSIETDASARREYRLRCKGGTTDAVEIEQPPDPPPAALFTFEFLQDDTYTLTLIGTGIGAVWSWSGGADVVGDQFNEFGAVGQTVSMNATAPENIEQIVLQEALAGPLFSVEAMTSLQRLEINSSGGVTGTLALLGTLPESLLYLLLDYNAITGSIPAGVATTAAAYFSGNALTGDIPTLTAGAIESFSVNDNVGITGVAAGFAVPASLQEFYAIGCSLTEEAVDAILAAFVMAGGPDGNINLSGGANAIPSAAGLASIVTLQGTGWLVIVNS